jgi:hypothetical protein
LNDRFKKRSAVENEDETQSLAAEARRIPEQTSNDEGRAAYLQINQRNSGSLLARSGKILAPPGTQLNGSWYKLRMQGDRDHHCGRGVFMVAGRTSKWPSKMQ